jgi:hypothetical protein
MNARLMSAKRTSSTGISALPVLLRSVDIFRKGVVLSVRLSEGKPSRA